VTLVRWRFVPEDGEKELTADQMAKAPNDFLESALITRTKQGPVRWKMIVTIGQPGDAETNPTVLWPKERKEIEAGTLSLTAATSQEGGVCYPINFDPLVMAEGIQPTQDPILLFRSPSYAASFALRAADK
jgi:catalase